MKTKKINRVILNTVSVAALLTSGAFASGFDSERPEKKSWLGKVWNSPSQYLTRYVSHPLETAGSFGRATKNTIISHGLEEKERRIEQIANYTGEFAALELRKFLFASPYEIFDTNTGKMSPNLVVLSKNSKVMENIFELLTGNKVDDLLDQLPIPARLFKNTIKIKIEKMVFDHVFGALANTGTKFAVKQALYGAYGIGKYYTSNMAKADMENDPSKALIKKALDNSLVEVGADIPSSLTAAQQQEIVNVQDLSLTDSALTIDDVLKYYNHRIKLSMNDIFKKALLKGIEAGSTFVAGKAYDESTQYTKKVMLGVSGAAISSGLVFPPMVAVGGTGIATTLMVDDYFRNNKGQNVKTAADLAVNFAGPKIGGPFKIDYEAEGKTTFKSGIDINGEEKEQDEFFDPSDFEHGTVLDENGEEVIDIDLAEEEELAAEKQRNFEAALQAKKNASHKPFFVKESSPVKLKRQGVVEGLADIFAEDEIAPVVPKINIINDYKASPSEIQKLKDNEHKLERDWTDMDVKTPNLTNWSAEKMSDATENVKAKVQAVKGWFSSWF